MLTTKLDLCKLHKDQYATPKLPAIIEIKPAQYFAVVGRGEPGGDVFLAKISALYNVAFTVKMTRKKATGEDYAVCKLEGIWWGSKGQAAFCEEPPSLWNWKLLIRTPDFIVSHDVEAAAASLLKKKKPRDILDVRLETIDEGLCVQALHVGPYREETETVLKMQQLAESQGLSFHGLHHEIYLSDPRRVPEERLRTILRMPVR